jgi:hypothetical protein
MGATCIFFVLLVHGTTVLAGWLLLAAQARTSLTPQKLHIINTTTTTTTTMVVANTWHQHTRLLHQRRRLRHLRSLWQHQTLPATAGVTLMLLVVPRLARAGVTVLATTGVLTQLLRR